MATERWTDEMLDRFASTVSVTLAGIGNAQISLSQNVDQLGQRVDQLGQQVEQIGYRVDQIGQRVDQIGQRVDQFITRTDETIARMDQAITELKAGQQQQARVLDYLLRKEQEPQNGST